MSHIRNMTFLAMGGLLVIVGGSSAAQAATAPPVPAQQNRVMRVASALQVIDAQIPSSGFPFSLTRYYHWDPTAPAGLLGKGWRLSLEVKMEVAAASVTFDDADGTALVFVKQSDGTYTAPQDAHYKLAATSQGYSLTSDDDSHVLHFDKTGRLATVFNGTGKGLTLAYTSTGRIASVSDAEGRVARFTTNSAGQLIYVTLPDDSRITYAYTSQGYLSRAAGADGTVRSYTYDAQGRLID